MGNPNDALNELRRYLKGDAPSSETLRLASIANLFLGDRDSAVEFARQGAARDSDSRACQQTLGIALFHRAMSPMVEPTAGEWPQPIDQPLVLSSDAAQADLSEAASLFESLAVDPDLTEHRGMVLWHFATLACMPSRRADAEARIKALQAAGAMPPPIIAWAVARGLRFDETAALATCDAKLEADPADFETLLIRVALTNARGDRGLARRWLDGGRAALEAAGHGNLYIYWAAVLDIDSHGTPPDAALASHPWLRLRVALEIRAKKPRLTAITEVLTTELESGHHPSLVIASAQFLLDGGWHNAAAKAASFLIDRIGTGEAISLAAYALYRTRDADGALLALDRTEAFPGGQLPVDLVRLRVECLAVMGEIVQASEESVRLARSTGSAADLWRSIDFQLAVGAAPAALALYDEHADKLAAPTPGHIRLAQAVLHFAPEAAARLTRQVAAAPPDELVTATFALASKLRLSKEQGDLIGRIQALGVAGAGGVELVHLDQIAERISKQHEQIEQALDRYRRGHAPIHMLVGFRAGVVASHLAQLLRPPQPKTRTPTLSTRYGRRFESEIWPEQRESVKLFADVTALLTAHGINLLDPIERAFKPVYIAPDTVSAVAQLRSDIETFQPARVDAARAVVAAFQEGDIVDQASSSQIDSFAVLWEHQGGDPDSTLNFTRLYELATARLGKRAVSSIKDALGNTIVEAGKGPKPPKGSTINLEIGMAVTLQEAGALAPLLGRYSLAVSADDVDSMRGSIAEAEASAELVTSLNALLERLASGLRDGSYKTVPLRDERDQDPIRRSLGQLMSAMKDGSALLWVDDRFFSSIDNANFRVVSTVEVIDSLRAYERITLDASFEFRQRLRAARWMFMPLDGDEIAYHLRKAVKGDAISETADLAILRRAVAETLLERRLLQWPDQQAAEKGVRGEVPFILDSGHSVAGALASLWDDHDVSIAGAESASEWIIKNLDIELFPLPVLPAGDARSDHLIGLHLAQLVLLGMQIRPSKVGRKRLAAYLDWIWAHIVGPSVRVRPERWSPMLAMMEQNLTHDVLEDEASEGIWLRFAGVLINALPYPLRVRLIERAKIREVFGIPDHGQVTVDKYDFDEIAFWSAIADAKAKGKTEILAASGEKARIRLVNTDPTDLHVKLDVGGESMRLDAWPWRVANDDPAIRRGALQEYADLFDLSEAQLDALNDELGKIPARAERARRAMHERHASMEQWYAELEQGVRQRKSFQIADLSPEDANKLVHLLRLDDDADLEQAAEKLIAERGLAIAIRRFGALPINPPKAIQAAVAALPAGQLPVLIEEIGDEGASPWLLLFLLRLLGGEKMPASPERDQLVQWMIKCVTEPDEQVRWDLYVTLARFVASLGHTMEGWSALSATQQLACCWLHAGLIAEILIRGQVRLEQLIALLDDHRVVSPRQLIADLNKFRGDRADPLQTSGEQVRFCAFAPLLLEEAGELKKDDPVTLALADLLLKVDDGQAHLRLRLAQSGLALTDHLQSYFAFQPEARFDPILPDARLLFGSGLDELIRTLLAADPETPNFAAGWSHLRMASGDGGLTPELDSLARERLPFIEKALELGTLLEKRLLLLAVTGLAAINGWIDLAAQIDAAALAIGPVEGESEDDDMLVFEIAIWRAKMEPDPIARTQTMARELKRLTAFPAMTERAILAAQHFATGLSGQETEAFVDLLAEYRASF